MSGLRWRVALVLNRIRRLCWTSLASWAIYGGRDERRWDSSQCERYADGTCYCGKVGPGR